jgi:hypothetical protein
MAPPNLPRLLAAAALAATFALAGCGSDAPAPAVDVSGTWIGPIESTAGPPGYEPVFGTYQMTLVLAQSGANVSGTFQSDVGLSGTAAGGVSGRTLTLRLAVAPCGGPGNAPGSLSLTGNVPAFTTSSLVVDYLGTACGVGDYGHGTLTRR